MKTVWTTQYGEKIPVSKLSDRHIKSILNMFDRKGFVSESIVMLYRTSYSMPKGDMAQMCFEQEFDHVMSCPVTEWIDILEAELLRRKESCGK